MGETIKDEDSDGKMNGEKNDQKVHQHADTSREKAHGSFFSNLKNMAKYCPTGLARPSKAPDKKREKCRNSETRGKVSPIDQLVQWFTVLTAEEN